MVYNRCIGTRYCSNNCPYKVRRFNFFNFTKDTPDILQAGDEPGRHGARARRDGEVHLLHAADQRGRRSTRSSPDASFGTATSRRPASRPARPRPSSSAICATRSSRVAKAKADPRNYALLDELNTKPRTTYLAKVRNPNPDLDGVRTMPAWHAGGRGPCMTRARLVLGALALASVSLLTGCARGCTSSRPPIHRQPEHGQPAEGTAADGQHVLLRRRVDAPARSRHGRRSAGCTRTRRFFTGKGADGQFVATIPVTVDEALLERGRQRYAIYCQPCHDARGDGKGILFQRGNVPTAILPPGQDPEVPGRADLRRHHERARADGRVPLADPSRGPVGDHRLRARARRRRRRGHAPTARRPRATVTEAAMNGVMNRKLLVAARSRRRPRDVRRRRVGWPRC